MALLGKSSRTMMRIKNGRFVFDLTEIRKDPASNLKDLWFREHACSKVYSHWLQELEDSAFIELANWCTAAHNLAAEKLHTQMLRLGDDIHLADHWRDLAAIPDLLATSLGAKVVIDDVDAMEKILLEDYMAKLQNFDGENLNLIQHELLPVQYKCAEAWGPLNSLWGESDDAR